MKIPGLFCCPQHPGLFGRSAMRRHRFGHWPTIQRHKRERVQQQKQAEADAAEAERCQRQEDNDIYEEVGFFSSAPDASTTEGIEDQSSFSASTVCCFMRVSFFFLSFRSTQLRVVLFFFYFGPSALSFFSHPQPSAYSISTSFSQ